MSNTIFNAFYDFTCTSISRDMGILWQMIWINRLGASDKLALQLDIELEKKIKENQQQIFMINVTTSISLSSTILTHYEAIYHYHLHNGVFVSQLIRYARASFTHDQFLKQGKLLTSKLKKTGLLTVFHLFS